jgi:hypothetical protein
VRAAAESAMSELERRGPIGFSLDALTKLQLFSSSLKRQHRNTSGMEIKGENSIRYGGNPSSMVRAACISAVAKPSVNRS